MKRTKNIMGMHITLEVVDGYCRKESFDKVFAYFRYVDSKFSPYKKDSEVSRINRGEIHKKDYSEGMWTILKLAEKTKRESNGYFDIWRNGVMDPSGIVKGWAIYNAGRILDLEGYKNYYIDAGGDIQTRGLNKYLRPWRVGIKNPFNSGEIVKVINIADGGVATSGTYERGDHIYNPNGHLENHVKSLTVVGSDVYEADRFATSAFAMGKAGINFIEGKPGLEGYMIGRDGLATFTSGFSRYVISGA